MLRSTSESEAAQVKGTGEKREGCCAPRGQRAPNSVCRACIADLRSAVGDAACRPGTRGALTSWAIQRGAVGVAVGRRRRLRRRSVFGHRQIPSRQVCEKAHRGRHSASRGLWDGLRETLKMPPCSMIPLPPPLPRALGAASGAAKSAECSRDAADLRHW